MTPRTRPLVIVGGGQSGLAAARGALDAGLRPLVLEAGDRPVGSWPAYYDSLTMFSPARFSTLAGHPFPGDSDHYPTRDEVVDYLARFADSLDAEIRTATRVAAVQADQDGAFVVHLVGGDAVEAAAVVAATGSFANPYVPELTGQDGFSGRALHVADYRNPKPYVGQRVVVVGAGNSAVQVAYELAEVASVTLATRQPLAFMPQHIRGHDIHHWHATTGFDLLPAEWLARHVGATLVLDTGDYRAAVDSGRISRRPMFTGFDGDQLLWADGPPEPADAVIYATGYRPSLPYLEPLGAVANGMPLHIGGLSSTHPGLAYVGLEFQRSFASNTLRGVMRDVEHVMPALAAHATRAHTVYGL